MTEAGASEIRKIIHVDMDAFFASIEQRDFPELKGKPVIIGGDPGKRGVVSTASYEARVYGIRSAMPSVTARRLCPQGIFLHGNMQKYREVSRQIREIFYRATDLVEPVSVDEAYLDVTVNHYGEKSATRVARRIQRQIFEELQLTCSAGVSYNKFLAKVASDFHKPAGLTVITPKDAEAFLEALPIRKFHGIGRVTAAKLLGMGVKYGRDLKKFERESLIGLFGKTGEYYYDIVRGIDLRPVEVEYERKSLGREITLERDCADLETLQRYIRRLSAKVADLLKQGGLAGKTVTVKIRYDNFETVTRSMTLRKPVRDSATIGAVALELLSRTEAGTRPVRLFGVTVGNFPDERETNAPIQLEFDFQYE